MISQTDQRIKQLAITVSVFPSFYAFTVFFLCAGYRMARLRVGGGGRRGKAEGGRRWASLYKQG